MNQFQDSRRLPAVFTGRERAMLFAGLPVLRFLRFRVFLLPIELGIGVQRE